MAPLLATVDDLFRQQGTDLVVTGLAWARALPLVVIVPAFGLRALPLAGRAAMGLAMAASLTSAMVKPPSFVMTQPWPALVAAELARGVPVAIATAIPLWAATMAGGLADALGGDARTFDVPTVEDRAGPIAIVLSLLAGATFLSTGGPALAMKALASADIDGAVLTRVVVTLTSGIGLAVAVAAPLIAASVIVEVGLALVARTVTPAPIQAAAAPLRALIMLALVGLLLERIADVLFTQIAGAP